MSTAIAEPVRHCPQCGSDRPISEVLCENARDGRTCGWPLLDEPISHAGASAPVSPPLEAPSAVRTCVNGHPMEADLEICMVCGADAAQVQTLEPSGDGVAPEINATVPEWLEIEGLSNLRPAVANDGQPFDTYFGTDSAERDILLTVYQPDAEPDPAVHDVLRRLSHDHVPDLFETGRVNGRAYEVTEFIGGGTLAEIGYAAGSDAALLRQIVSELGAILTSFEEIGLRHRDLNPSTIWVRTYEPLDLVVTGFGSARLSDFDLESVAPLELTRYSAPEAIVGAVSAASDWWSLGMIVLEQATAGRCFEGINDRAFHLSVVTRGVEIPDLEPRLRLLLRGLLARDPHARWSSDEVRRWLNGDEIEVAEEDARSFGVGNGQLITLGDQQFARADLFALAAANATHWDEAQALLMSGAVATWLTGAKIDPQVQARVRRHVGNEHLSEDDRQALALLAMNPDLPLTLRGEIVTPGWLLTHPDAGYELVTGEVARQLEQAGREPWIVALASRAEAVRDRAKLLEIELDETKVRVALLASSRANLEAERDEIRKVFPDTEHPGLASIMERPRLSEEDLIILVSAATSQFLPLATLVNRAEELAYQHGIDFDRDDASRLFVTPRREVFAEIDARTANFARCGIVRIDEWVDTFRVERRMLLARAAIVLGVAQERWEEPPKQQYLANLLGHFEKRVTGAVSRGPLARFGIGKTTPRIDLSEMGTALRPAESILNHILSRADVPVSLDPQAYADDSNRESRLRRLVSHAQTFKRDTGLDGRTLGFPFLVVRDAKRAGADDEARPRIAPVLLWPVVLDFPPGAPSATISFDREREEVRLNPALEAILPPESIQKWKETREELLSRGAIRHTDVIDAFGTLASPRSRSLERVPPRDAKVPLGTFELLPAAALFNAEFTGQAIAEDLRQLVRMPAINTGLEAMLRLGVGEHESPAMQPDNELDRFLVVPADPSQEAAVQRSRLPPGLLVEGPPGTGKSQTIVNVVTDAIGRGDTVLVICQKQAALQVVQKRLDAEGMGDRLFLVNDINKDRESVIRAMREQRDRMLSASGERRPQLLRQRAEKIARIQTLESEVDNAHRALFRRDDASGFTYRELLGELIDLEAEGPWIEAAALRTLLGGLNPSEISPIEETCGSLAGLWLKAKFEGSPLSVLRSFPVDAATKVQFAKGLAASEQADIAREDVLAQHPSSPEINDPADLRKWITEEVPRLEGLEDNIRWYLGYWLDLFGPKGGSGSSEGATIIDRLAALSEVLEALPHSADVPPLFQAILNLDDLSLDRLIEDAAGALKKATIFSVFNLRRHGRDRRLSRFLVDLGMPADHSGKLSFQAALTLERELRPPRRAVLDACKMLAIQEPAEVDVASLAAFVGALRGILDVVSRPATAAFLSPWQSETLEAVRAQEPAAITALKSRMLGSLARFNARQESVDGLRALEQWIEPDWIAAAIERTRSNASNQPAIKAIHSAMDSLESFQRFRLRSVSLSELVMRAFAILREWEDQLEDVSTLELDGLVRRTVRREALLSWKARMESQSAELSIEPGEIHRKVAVLANLDREVLELNRQVLRLDVDEADLGSASAWDGLTRLRGPRARRLREIVDQGTDLGLMQIRPIWLMNPDVASRILPLKAGLFDIAIYDEASQMPVEFAVPTLFRARRVLVSGDEKQMPPTSFFSSRVDDGEEEGTEDGEPFGDHVTDTERIAQEETWNRREIKDCPDLLHLGRAVLPTATLQIHYRSKYRELIGYSNAAFYRNELSVPVRHPDSEIRRVQPIEVVRADGVYEAQTNQTEADAVVRVVADIWQSPTPPSVGVVTFNRKQADLVEEAFDRRAEEDSEFLRAYQRERERTQNSEDMGFFVKNVENVQGDERDVIVFSTTFGRDKHGAFRRVFGVLGQAGGERRLNVAVTRAREKVVLVTSMPVKEVSEWLAKGQAPSSPRDYLQAYLDYAARVSSGELESAREAASRLNAHRSRSSREPAGEADGLVRSVGRFLLHLGVEAVSTGERDAFSLDFAVKNPRTGQFGLGVDCDAPKHPLLERARAREIWRTNMLRKEIPALHRVSSIGWYGDPEAERERLQAAVQAALV